jgi:hypothetical protein
MKRFWLFAMWFTAFWILNSSFEFIYSLLIEKKFNTQPIFLIIGMLLLFLESRYEYRNFREIKNNSD